MNLCYYFFKEQTRIYDKADVLAFFQSMPEFRLQMVNEEYHLIYTNALLNFSAKFILGTKSIVPNIDKLNPSFYDVCIRLELPLLLPTFKAEQIFKVCGDFTQRFNFFVYNELYEDVSPYRINMMVQAYNKIKQAYKMKYEEEFMQYYKAQPNILSCMYDYILHKESIVAKYKNERLTGLDYVFLAEKGDRNIKLGVYYDGFTPFIMPPYVDYIIHCERDIRYIDSDEFFAKCGKIIKMADTNVFGVSYITLKDMKKIRKVLKKTKFSFIPNTFEQIEETKILDL